MRRFLMAVAASGAALAAAASAADAQTIGARLGASFSRLTLGGEEENIDRVAGFVGGGFVRFDFGRPGVQVELLTAARGASFDGAPGDTGDFDFSLEYVEIPVLLHVPLSMGPSFAPYVVAGPAFAFRIGCDDDTGVDIFDCDSIRSSDIGLAAGAGLAFAMGPGALLLEGRYTWGMTNIVDDPGNRLENRSAYLTAGYFVPLSMPY